MLSRLGVILIPIEPGLIDADQETAEGPKPIASTWVPFRLSSEKNGCL
jgi:hypothetical protein